MPLYRTPPDGNGAGDPPPRSRAQWGGGNGGRPGKAPEHRPPWNNDFNNDDNGGRIADGPDGQKMYRCKQCGMKMPNEDAQAHHKQRGGPCELVRCGACRNPILRGLLSSHKEKCSGNPGGAGQAPPSPPEQAARPAPREHDRGVAAARAGAADKPRAGHAGPSVRERLENRAPDHREYRDHGRGHGPSDLGSTMNSQKVYVGDRVLCEGKPGEVMWVGELQNIRGQAVGVKLDAASIDPEACDGKVRGQRYFRCAEKHGIFVPIHVVKAIPASHPAAAGPPGGGGGKAVGGPRAPVNNVALDVQKRGEPWEKNVLAMAGMEQVKKKIYMIRNALEVNHRRAAAGGRADRPASMLIAGKCGSGRTTVLDAIGKMLAAFDPTRRRGVGVVKPPRQELIHPASNSRSAELIQKAVTSARGGVLCIDNLSDMVVERDGQVHTMGKEWLETLGAEINNAAKEEYGSSVGGIVLLVTADSAHTAALLKASGALRSLLSTTLELPDLTPPETCQLMERFAKIRGFQIEEGATRSLALHKYVNAVTSRAEADQRNAHLATRLLEEAVQRQTERVHAMGTVSKASLTLLTEEDLLPEGGAGMADPSEAAIDACMTKLEAVVGLDKVKEFLRSLRAQLALDRERRAAGLPSLGTGALHMVFSGNPGTGKTTVARIIAEMFAALGVLRKGQLIEVDRGGLVAGYSGQTAIKTQEVVQTALGGMLFVDEAYALVNSKGDSFGREALDTLLKMMEDHRDDLVVIFAGYEREMRELMNQNSGLTSRFPTWLVFEDYNSLELMQIAKHMMTDAQMAIQPEAMELLQEGFERMCAKQKEQEAKEKAAAEKADASGDKPREPQESKPSNGRAVRNLIEQIQRKQALRLAEQKGPKTIEDLTSITSADVGPVVKDI